MISDMNILLISYFLPLVSEKHGGLIASEDFLCSFCVLLFCFWEKASPVDSPQWPPGCQNRTDGYLRGTGTS